MVRHVIIWKLKDDLSDSEKNVIKENIKSNLEALVEKIDGLRALSVQVAPLPTSNCDLMLDSTFDSVDALSFYASHPDHVAIAKNDVIPYVATRSCIDFEID